MNSPNEQQWPRGPENDLHRAAFHGSADVTTAVLSSGAINIDQGTPGGKTPLMFAAQKGHLRVTRTLLKRGANMSIAGDDGMTALHISAHGGHLAVTMALVKAGADMNANHGGVTPLYMAAQGGHSGVMAAMIEAGADVDCRTMRNGRTPLYVAAMLGHLDVIKELLRANADPLLGMTEASGDVHLPLEIATRLGHAEVVCELIRQVRIEGCGGEHGGVHALAAAAQEGYVHIMTILTDAGVIDNGIALHTASECSQDMAVKFLLQQHRRKRGPTVGYVNSCTPMDNAPLLRSIQVFTDDQGKACLISPRVVRLLIDGGADTSSAVCVRNVLGGEVIFYGTPLAFTSSCLRTKQVRGRKATEEQMFRLEAVRRLLLRVEAVHAASWLWPRGDLLVAGAAEVSTRRAARNTPANGTQLGLMLPILRRRRRGVILATLFRYSSYP